MRRATLRSVLAMTCVLMAATAPLGAETSPGDCVLSADEFVCGYLLRAANGPQPRQGPGDPQPETTWTDVTHTKLDIEVDPTARTVFGTVTIDVTSQVNGLTEFVVYLHPTSGAMTVSSVGGNGTGFAVAGDKITITLDGVYDIDGTFTVSIDYGGSPTRGIYWGSHNNGVSVVDIVATLSEPFSARGWWAGKDVLNDKCTFDIWVTVVDTLVVAGNGILNGRDVMPGGKLRYRWEEINPMIPYLCSLAIGDYEIYSTTYNHLGDSCPMEFYILPERNPAWQSWGDKYVTQTEVFSDLYGQYPFVNEKGGMAHTPTLGGTYMEHQTIPSMPRFDIEWINAHELAHQWFGDNITCETWGDVWLNEGFASWSEAVWREFRPGGSPAAYHSRMAVRRPSNPDAQVYVTNVNSVGSIFSGNSTYNKGSWMVHMLRRVLGDATLFQAIRDYRAAHEGDSATTAEFAASISQTAGYDLSFYTDQWVMNPGSPDYEYGWLPASAGGQDYLLLEITQTQGARGYGLFIMPVDIAVTTANGTTTYVVWSLGVGDTFAVPVDGVPLAVDLDPDDWILTHNVTETPMAAPAVVCQGDMNEDGAIRGDDISLFVAAVLDASAGPAGWRRADMNLDGGRDMADVPLFVNGLIGASSCANH